MKSCAISAGRHKCRGCLPPLLRHREGPRSPTGATGVFLRRLSFNPTHAASLLGALLLVMLAPATEASDWTAEPGLHSAKLELKGLNGHRRKSFYYVPEDLPESKKVPLVIALHGGLSNPKNIRRRSRLNELADREKLIAVYPQGNGIFNFFLHWNAGFCCAKAQEQQIDDPAFLVAVIDKLADALPIDQSRVYVFGFSNGAMLSYQLASRYPDRIAAIAALSGTYGRLLPDGRVQWPENDSASSMPTLIIHGSEDPRLPWDGSDESIDERGGIGMVPTLEIARFWARRNRCSDGVEVPSGFSNVSLTRWLDCASGAPVDLYRLGGWGHRWAGRSVHTKADYKTVGGFESIDVIWDFFHKHRSDQSSVR